MIHDSSLASGTDEGAEEGAVGFRFARLISPFLFLATALAAGLYTERVEVAEIDALGSVVAALCTIAAIIATVAGIKIGVKRPAIAFAAIGGILLGVMAGFLINEDRSSTETSAAGADGAGGGGSKSTNSSTMATTTVPVDSAGSASTSLPETSASTPSTLPPDSPATETQIDNPAPGPTIAPQPAIDPPVRDLCPPNGMLVDPNPVKVAPAEEDESSSSISFAICATGLTPDVVYELAIDCDGLHVFDINNNAVANDEGRIKLTAQVFGSDFGNHSCGNINQLGEITVLLKSGSIIHRKVGLTVDPTPTT